MSLTNRQKNDLDNYITGHYGEDQFSDEDIYDDYEANFEDYRDQIYHDNKDENNVNEDELDTPDGVGEFDIPEKTEE